MGNEVLDKRFEWQTLALIFACYVLWLGTTVSFSSIVENYGFSAGVLLLFGVTALSAAFHTSLQHEVVHGHPTPYGWLNEALIFPSLIFVYPFRRYRALHLKHHIDENLTDPYDDPESYYWPQSIGQKLRPMTVLLLNANNTFIGRMIIGTPLGLYGFYKTEWQRIRNNEQGVITAWLLHVIGFLPVIYWIVVVCQIPFWVYVVFVIYPGVSWILVRSFAEHQAAEQVGGRSAIVEAHPFFSLLYLNNNLHIVHHASPSTPWYDLPALYRERRQLYLAANQDYRFEGYWQIVSKFAFTRKQPIVHPLFRRESGDR